MDNYSKEDIDAILAKIESDYEKLEDRIIENEILISALQKTILASDAKLLIEFNKNYAENKKHTYPELNAKRLINRRNPIKK